MMTRIAALLLTATLGAAAHAAETPFAIAVHGGAGEFTRVDLAPEREAACRAALEEALESGRRILAGGGSSLDAVVAAVKVLEDSPYFNAGRGAVLTRDGTHEMDASVMDGRDGRAGAVAGVSRVRNPVAAARAVMERSEHVMLAGTGAEAFAREQGLAIVEPSWFDTEERREEWRRSRGKAAAPAKLGTVGAVALDRHGNLASATSTGGVAGKRRGRIGNTPIVGAGTWADNPSVAVSATGSGEMFIRTAAAHEIAALVKYKGLAPQAAADEALARVKAIGGQGGVIVLDRGGNPVFSFTTQAMYRGYAKGTARPEVHVFR